MKKPAEAGVELTNWLWDVDLKGTLTTSHLIRVTKTAGVRHTVGEVLINPHSLPIHSRMRSARVSRVDYPSFRGSRTGGLLTRFHRRKTGNSRTNRHRSLRRAGL